MNIGAQIIAAGIVLTAIGLLRKAGAKSSKAVCTQTSVKNRKVLLFGDSQAQTALGVAICRQLEAADGVCNVAVSTNGGKSSYQNRIKQKLDKLVTDTTRFTDVVLIFGVNDIANGKSAASTRSNINKLASIAGQRGARVYIVPPTTWNKYSGRTATLPGRQQNTVELQAALMLDARANVSLLPYQQGSYIVVGDKGLPSYSRLWGKQGLDRQLSTDGLHYNTSAGRAAVAQHIAKAMTTKCN
ncbi:MAG: hypothetical protein CMM76_17530 [Rhodospirillaceae bacterium]|nr:hypothetical protein [Rhodospirillaceae bacterium]